MTWLADSSQQRTIVFVSVVFTS